MTFLTRRIAPAQAERMMLNARVYPVEELLRMGVIDQVVPRGEGLQAAADLIKRHQRMSNSRLVSVRVWTASSLSAS